MNKIEVDLSQEKIDFINDAYQKELQHWKKVDWESVLTENEAKELIDLTLLRVWSLCLWRAVETRELLFKISEWKNIPFFWSNNWLLKNFFKIYERRWRLYSVVGYRLQKNLSCRFEDWLCRECKIIIEIFTSWQVDECCSEVDELLGKHNIFC